MVKNKGKPKTIEPEMEERLRAEMQTLELIREARKHPIKPDEELAAKHKLSPSERLAPYLSITPQPVLDRLDQVTADRDRLFAELIERDRIIERMLRTLEAQRTGGKKAPSTSMLDKDWPAIWEGIKRIHPDWTIQRLDAETALTCRVSESTVKAARLKLKKKKTDP